MSGKTGVKRAGFADFCFFSVLLRIKICSTLRIKEVVIDLVVARAEKQSAMCNGREEFLCISNFACLD